jgi:predicted RNase H-like nuclease (RuvC/YqgF family)
MIHEIEDANTKMEAQVLEGATREASLNDQLATSKTRVTQLENELAQLTQLRGSDIEALKRQLEVINVIIISLMHMLLIWRILSPCMYLFDDDNNHNSHRMIS